MRSISNPKITGFTLMEVFVVVIILAILLSFAVPAFLRSQERGLLNEARAGLKLIYSAEKMRFIERGSYTPNIIVDQDIYLNQRNWQYAVTLDNGFTATATRTAGAFEDCQIQIDAASSGEPEAPSPVNSGKCP